MRTQKVTDWISARNSLSASKCPSEQIDLSFFKMETLLPFLPLKIHNEMARLTLQPYDLIKKRLNLKQEMKSEIILCWVRLHVKTENSLIKQQWLKSASKRNRSTRQSCWATTSMNDPIVNTPGASRCFLTKLFWATLSWWWQQSVNNDGIIQGCISTQPAAPSKNFFSSGCDATTTLTLVMAILGLCSPIN